MRAHLSRVALTIVMSVSSPLAITSAQERAAEPEQAEEQIRQARITAQKAAIHLHRNQLARIRRLFEANAVSEGPLRQAERDLAKATLQLAIIENDAVTIVDQLELIVAASAAELKRLTILNDKGAVTEKQLLQARAELEQATAQLAAARSKRTDSDANRDSKLKTLLVQRRDVLQERFNLVQARYRSGEVLLNVVIQAASELSAAELELAEPHAQRISDCEQWHERMKQLERIVKERFKSGEAARDDVLNTTAACLEAEIRLHRERNLAISRAK